MSLKNPDAIAALVSALRVVHGDEVARTMLQEGMSLATLIDTMFSAPIAHRDAVRYVASALDDFAITPELGPSGIFVTCMMVSPAHFASSIWR